MFSRISHIMIYVRDMEGMISFWETLGLEPSYKSEMWTEYNLDNIVMALHTADEVEPHFTGIIFEVDNIDKVVEKLDELGVERSGVEDIGFGKHLFFKDPEGNSYQVYQPKKENSG